MFSAAQYAAWMLVVLSSGVLLIHLGRSQGSIRILRAYLFAQIAYAAILIPITLWSPASYYIAYVGVSIADYLLQFVLLWGIAQHLKGKFAAFGRIRNWALTTLFLTTLAASRSLLVAPFDGWPALWTRVDQVLYIGRTVALVGVGLYGWVLASCWPRKILLVWLGMGAYGGADFGSSRLDILTSYTHHHVLQYIPTFGFLAAAALWWRVNGVPSPICSNPRPMVQQYETALPHPGPLGPFGFSSDLLKNQEPPELPEALPSFRQL